MRSVFLTLVLMLAAFPGHTSEPTRITIVQGSLGFNFVPLAVARAEGYFEQEGLQVEVVLTGAGPKAMTALLGGGGAFSASVLLDGIMAHRKGLDDVRAIATLSHFYNAMVIRKEVASDLGISLDLPLKERVTRMKGMRIGVTTPGASSDLAIRYLALSNGLSPDRDLQIVPLGGVAPMIAGMQARQVDGCACIPGVDVVLKHQGLAIDLMRPGELADLDGITNGTLYTLASYAAAHPDVVQAVARGVTRATMLIARDPIRAKNDTRPTMKEMDDATFEQAWKTYLPYLPKDPDITESDFNREMAFEKLALPPNVFKPVNYDAIVDASYVRAAAKALVP